MQFHRVASKAPSGSNLADFPALSGSVSYATANELPRSISPDLSKLIDLCDENIASHFKKKGKVAPYNATARFPAIFESKKGAKLLQSLAMTSDEAIVKIVDNLKTKYYHYIQKDGSHYLDTRPSNRSKEDDSDDVNKSLDGVSEGMDALTVQDIPKAGSSGASSSSVASSSAATPSNFWASNSLTSKKVVSEAEFGLTADHTDSARALRELIALCRVKVERFDFKKGKDRFDATLSFEKVFQTKQGTDLLAASGLGTEAAVDQIVHAVKGDFFAFVDNSHYFLALERPNNVAKKSSINDMRMDTSKKKLTK